MRFRKMCPGLAAVLILSAIVSGCSKQPPGPADRTDPRTDTHGVPDSVGYSIGDNLPEDMPVMRIDTLSGQEITSRDYTLPAAVDLEESLGIYGFTDLSAQVRCRGNYTYYGEGILRKSFRVKFDNAADPLGLGNGASKSWVLLPNWLDRSMLRCYAAFAMARQLRFGFSSDAAFVELYVNGDYRGVYLLCEHHSCNDRRIDIDERPGVLDSDYLIELDMRAGETGVEGVDYFTAAGKQYVVKNDEIHPDALTFLSGVFEELDAAIQSGDRAAVEAVADLDSFVDMYILQEYAMNVDVGWASLFFVKEGGGKLYLTFPWDFDLAFGNYAVLGDANYNVLYVGGDAFPDFSNISPMFRGLMRCDWFAELVAKRFDGIGENLRDTALYEIDAVTAVYTDEIQKTYEKYPTLGTDFVPLPHSIAKLKTYEETVKQFSRWIVNRWEWLDGRIG